MVDKGGGGYVTVREDNKGNNERKCLGNTALSDSITNFSDSFPNYPFTDYVQYSQHIKKKACKTLF